MMKKDDEENKNKSGQEKITTNSVHFDYSKYQPYIEEVVRKFFFILEIKKSKFA